MKYSVYRFTLDIHVTRSQVSIPVLYRDTGVRFLISLSDGGKPYVIQKGNSAVFYGKKADGRYLCKPCVIKCDENENGTEIQYDFTEQTTSCKGIIDAEIRLFGTDRKLITSPSFNIVVDPRVLRDEDLIESVTETSPLDNVMLTAIEKVSNAVNKTLPEGVTLQVIESNIDIDGDLTVRENLTVDGDLVIKGDTISVAHETLTVNDNIIVTNAGSTNLDSLSGLVINSGETDEEGNYKGYGIVYEPSSDSVKLGLGTITKSDDKLAEFAFDEGQAQSVATRDKTLSEAPEGTVPVWDAESMTLKSSEKTFGNIVDKDYADKSYVKNCDKTDGVKYVYISESGVNSFLECRSTAKAYSIPQRDVFGRIAVGNSMVPLDDHAISKEYADANYTKQIDNDNGAFFYARYNGKETYRAFSATAKSEAAVLRDTESNIALPDQIANPPLGDKAISKNYADATYVSLPEADTSWKVPRIKNHNEVGYVKISSAAGATNSILQTNSEGYCKAKTPEDGEHIANKNYVDDRIANASLGEYANGTTFCHTITIQGEDEAYTYEPYQIKLIFYSPYAEPFSEARILSMLPNYVGQFVSLLNTKTNTFIQLPIIKFLPVFNQIYFSTNNDVDNPEKLITIQSLTDVVTSI